MQKKASRGFKSRKGLKIKSKLTKFKKMQQIKKRKINNTIFTA